MSNLRQSQIMDDNEDELYMSQSDDETLETSDSSEEYIDDVLYQCLKCLNIKKRYLFPNSQDKPIVCGDCTLDDTTFNEICSIIKELYEPIE